MEKVWYAEVLKFYWYIEIQAYLRCDILSDQSFDSVHF